MGVCARCGAQNDGASVFCPGCGAVQTPTGQAAPPEQPQYGQYGRPQPYGAPAWGTPPPPPPPPGGWTSQAGTTGEWEQPGPYATAPVGPPPQRPRDPKLLLLVLGVVGMVVVAGVIAFLLLSRHGSTSSNVSASATASSAAPSTGQAPSSSASASPTGAVRSVVGTPEAAPSGTAGAQLALAASGADCTYPPSVDGNNQPVTYEAGKAVDTDPTTAWRCPGAGGHTVELRGAGSTSDLGLIPGYAKVDPATGVNRFTDNHTVTQVVWRLRQGPNTVQVVQDIPNPTPQTAWVHLPGTYAFDSISVTVTGTGNPGARQDSTPISTIAVWGSTATPAN